MKSLEALENITNWIEYFTRLDYVEPIVRGEVQKNFYDAYHKTRPELELIEKDLNRLEKQDKTLKILNEYKETIKKRIESLEEYKNYTYKEKNENEYFKAIGSLDAYKNVLSLLSEVLDNDK